MGGDDDWVESDISLSAGDSSLECIELAAESDVGFMAAESHVTGRATTRTGQACC
jgi:hypothetical protein